MKMLMLTPAFPYPADNGSGIRMLNSIKSFSKHYDITLISTSEREVPEEHIKYMQQFCKKVIVYQNISTKKESILKFFLSKQPYQMIRYPGQPVKNQLKKDLLNSGGVLEFDIIYFHFIQTIPFVDFQWIAEKTCLVLDEHNADEIYWKSYAVSNNIFYRVFGRMNIERVKTFKHKVLPRLDFLISVSEQDKNYNEENYQVQQGFVFAPNGTDIEFFSGTEARERENIILFVGSMNVTMNIEAVLAFYEKCYPIIKAYVDNVKFYIVGKDPGDKIRDLEKRDSSVKVTGGVPDVRDYYKIAKLAIAPFQYGGGTKLKVLEAMAMNTPIVTTTIGCQGIDVENGKHAVIEDDMDKFAMTVVDILKNKTNTELLISSGRELVCSHYSWDSIYKKVLETIAVQDSL